MKNNLQWFQSPRPNSFNFSQTLQHQEPFPDLSNINPNNLTPTPIAHHPLSPFTPHNHRERQDNQSSSHNSNEQIKNREINHLVVFSEGEDDDERITPRAHRQYKKNEDIMTTGRKQSFEKRQTAKKSRPKDKGLRGLSMKAFNTVLQMKQGTYKQVAAKLLGTFRDEDESERPANQETNIKRRVYDALNVLISLGLLKKQGRMIVGQKKPQAKRKEIMKEYNQLRQKISIKQMILREKKNKKIQSSEKYKGVQTLFQNNKNNYEIVQLNGTFIPFPFIGVLASNSQWHISQITSEELEMKFKQMIHPFGDIDCLKQLHKHFK